MAREGYGGGDPEKVMQMPVGIVLAMIQYERFRDDYESAYIALNRTEGNQ